MRSFKILLFCKFLLIAGLMLWQTKIIRFGEKTSQASDSNEQPEQGEPVEESAKKKAKRTSYIGKLLNLPEINPTELKQEEASNFLSLIEKKKMQISERMQALEERENRLKDIEKSIDTKLSKLDEDRQFFLETVQKEKVVKKERLDQLVSYYQKMSPKKAAPVIEELDRDLAVALFKAMPEKQNTKILEAMDPGKSRELTEYFGRIKSITEYELLQEMNSSLQKEFEDCKVY